MLDLKYKPSLNLCPVLYYYYSLNIMYFFFEICFQTIVDSRNLSPLVSSCFVQNISTSICPKNMAGKNSTVDFHLDLLTNLLHNYIY